MVPRPLPLQFTLRLAQFQKPLILTFEATGNHIATSPNARVYPIALISDFREGLRQCKQTAEKTYHHLSFHHLHLCVGPLLPHNWPIDDLFVVWHCLQQLQSIGHNLTEIFREKIREIKFCKQTAVSNKK